MRKSLGTRALCWLVKKRKKEFYWFERVNHHSWHPCCLTFLTVKAVHIRRRPEGGHPWRESMLRKLLVVGGFAVVLALSCLPAQADSVGTLTLTDCGGGQSGCPAATYSFNITSTSASLTINITGAVTASVNNQITGVDLGFSPSNNVTLLGATFPSGAVGWTATTGSLSNSGCGSNSGAFVCSFSATGLTIVQGGTYVWTWNYTLTDPSKIFAASDVHIGANYGPANGLIVSQTGATTPVPEPGTLALFGSGLLGIARIIRRRLST